LVIGECVSDKPKFPLTYRITDKFVFSHLLQKSPELYSDTLKMEPVFYSEISHLSNNTLRKSPSEGRQLETTLLRLANSESFLLTNWLRGTEPFVRS